jgi:excisionase family DNA binding protein
MGVCAHTIDRMIKNDGLQAIRRGQRFVRIHRDDLDAFIKGLRGSGKRYV